MNFYLLLIIFFLIAVLYSSVGFGGGSSYLALMGVMAIAPDVMRPTALLCNIVVVTGACVIYYRENQIDLERSWPFVLSGVPFAFVGGLWPIKEHTFFQLLGGTLILAAILLWWNGKQPRHDQQKNVPLSAALGIGGSIGLLSGLVSIGGGIFLSPVLHLLKWHNARKIAALASLFILVNSISGLAGSLVKLPHLDWSFTLPAMAVVFAGGQIGSRLGARKFNLIYIKRTTAILILIAGANILKEHW